VRQIPLVLLDDPVPHRDELVRRRELERHQLPIAAPTVRDAAGKFGDVAGLKQPTMKQGDLIVTGSVTSRKTLVGISGVTLLPGALGAQKFLLGYVAEGVIMCVVSVLGAILYHGIPTAVMAIIGLIEGIIYLTKSDDEFTTTYIAGKKKWF
jgi:TM2 domain-containing membrane protein YozV